MFDLPPPNPGMEFSIASRGISKGIAQTDGPQLLARAFADVGEVQVGGQWKNVTSPVAKGEGAAFVTWKHKFGRVQATLGATFKFQTGVTEPADAKALELNGSLAPKWGKAGIRLAAIYSPDDLGSAGRSLYVEAGPSYDLTGTLRLSAAVGRRQRVRSPDYTSFNAGLTKTIDKLSLEARYYRTAQNDLGDPYCPRLVVTARLAW